MSNFRIFKFDSMQGEPETMKVIANSDIELQYNVYGLYQESTSYNEDLKEYKDELKSAFEEYKEENENITISMIKSFIVEFDNDYEFYPEGFCRQYGKPKKSYMSNDYDFKSSLDGYYDDEKCRSEADTNGIEYYSFWDGHNHREVILDYEYNSIISEVTHQYSDFEEWEIIASSRRDTCGQKYYFDRENKKFIAYEWSAYVGSLDYYTEVYPLDLLGIVSEIEDEEIIEIINEAIKNELSKQLKKGEVVEIKDGAVCFTFRNEDYHYSKSQIEEKGYFGTEYNIDLSIAREAIEIRRKEKVTERFAQNNYKAVEELPLEKIFIEYEDSIEAGNCVEFTDDLEYKVRKEEGITGKFALRADVLLTYRDDNYSRRAILKAYQNHYVKLS